MAGSPKLANSEDFLSGDWSIKAQEIRGIRSKYAFFDLLRKCDSMICLFDMEALL